MPREPRCKVIVGGKYRAVSFAKRPPGFTKDWRIISCRPPDTSGGGKTPGPRTMGRLSKRTRLDCQAAPHSPSFLPVKSRQCQMRQPGLGHGRERPTARSDGDVGFRSCRRQRPFRSPRELPPPWDVPTNLAGINLHTRPPTRGDPFSARRPTF